MGKKLYSPAHYESVANRIYREKVKEQQNNNLAGNAKYELTLQDVEKVLFERTRVDVFEYEDENAYFGRPRPGVFQTTKSYSVEGNLDVTRCEGANVSLVLGDSTFEGVLEEAVYISSNDSLPNPGYACGNKSFINSDYKDTGEDYCVAIYFYSEGRHFDLTILERSSNTSDYSKSVFCSIWCEEYTAIDPKYIPQSGGGFSTIKYDEITKAQAMELAKARTIFFLDKEPTMKYDSLYSGLYFITGYDVTAEEMEIDCEFVSILALKLKSADGSCPLHFELTEDEKAEIKTVWGL